MSWGIFIWSKKADLGRPQLDAMLVQADWILCDYKPRPYIAVARQREWAAVDYALSIFKSLKRAEAGPSLEQQLQMWYVDVAALGNSVSLQRGSDRFGALTATEQGER